VIRANAQHEWPTLNAQAFSLVMLDDLKHLGAEILRFAQNDRLARSPLDVGR
jgi:hypothetical protein